MAQTTSLVSSRVLEILHAPSTGLNSTLGALSTIEGVRMQPLPPHHVRAQNVAAEIADKSAAAKYPAIQVYCEKLSNQLREKFRVFSGKARMVIEARVSEDRLEELEQGTALMVDAITSVLDSSRGDWGNGMLFNGGYEVLYGPVKHGGRNFLQVTKVVFEVDISTN